MTLASSVETSIVRPVYSRPGLAAGLAVLLQGASHLRYRHLDVELADEVFVPLI